MMKIALLFIAFTCMADLCYAEQSLTATDPASVCHNEVVLLEIWRAQGLIYSIEYKGSNAQLLVHQRQWLRSRADVQADVALAAYCRIAAEYGRGNVEVTGLNGTPVFGAVIDGRWRNRLSGN